MLLFQSGGAVKIAASKADSTVRTRSHGWGSRQPKQFDRLDGLVSEPFALREALLEIAISERHDRAFVNHHSVPPPRIIVTTSSLTLTSTATVQRTRLSARLALLRTLQKRQPRTSSSHFHCAPGIRLALAPPQPQRSCSIRINSFACFCCPHIQPMPSIDARLKGMSCFTRIPTLHRLFCSP